MQAIHLYLLFLTTCGFAQVTSLPDPEDNILLDVKKFPSAEKNPAPNPEDDDISVNVEDLQRELLAERTKNRDLNQTISDILEEMEDMKKNIMRNEEKITDNESSVFLLTRDVEDLQEHFATVQGEVVSVTADVEKNSANITKVSGDLSVVQDEVVSVGVDVEENSALITNILDDVVSLTSSDQQQTMQIETLTSSDQQQAMEIESLGSQIDSLGARGTWCAVQDGSWKTEGTITYDRITFSASNNMNISTTPLDINSGLTVTSMSQVLLLSHVG